MRTPPVYNAVEKTWSGPALNKRHFDIPFGELLLNQLAKHGDKLIQINHDTGERMTCKEMRLKSLKVAENLDKIGIQRGDHVSIIAHYRNDVAPFYVGVVAYGAVVNMMFLDSTAHELSHLFEVIKPKLIVCDGEVIDKVTKSLENVTIDPMIYAFAKANERVRSMEEFFISYDTEPSKFQLPKIVDLNSTKALLLSTSGSTGLPKCVAFSHAMALSSMSSTLASEDGLLRYYGIVPAGSVTSIDIASSIFYRSPRIITAQPLTIDLMLDVLHKHDVKVLFLFPFNVAALAKRLLTESRDLTKLTTILTGGSSQSDATRMNLEKALPNIEIGCKYGMTEIGIISCSNANTKNGSVGYLVAGMSAKIVGEDGNCMGPGELGEIYLRRCCPILGYLNNEEATKSVIDADGWLHTADVGYFDTDGDLFVVERKRILIKYKSQQVQPSILEEFIRNNFDVQEVIVVGVPGEDDIGHLPAAVVVLSPNSTVTETDISKAIEENYSDNNYLRGGVYFVNALPQTTNGYGKVQRCKVEQIALELYKTTKMN